MKRLQRRSKQSLPAANVLSGRMTGRIKSYQDRLWTRWQTLSPRDQLALGILLVFLLLFVGSYGGYHLHQAAKDSKADYQAQVADYFWLRAQAGNIDSSTLDAANTQSNGTIQPPASSISLLLNTAGIDDAQVVAAGNTIQLSFTHASQAIVSAALSQLEQQGWQFTQLSMQQDLSTKQIQVQATVAL